MALNPLEIMADDAERVTLVIPGRNAAPTLAICLDAVVPLLGKDGLQEIIFVDDGSTDDTPAIVAHYPVRHIRTIGGGPAHARNLGWRTATTPLIWFIDSDCVAEPDALHLLLPHLKNAAVAGVGGTYGNMRPDSLLACLIHEEIVERHRTMSGDVNYLATFNVVYRRTALEAVGGFDETYRTAEDIELAFRLHDAGHRLRFEGNSRVGHFHATHFWRYLRSQRQHGYFRVWLYLHHRGRATGDAYSGLVDHIQPPLSVLIVALLPMMLLWLPLGWFALVAALLLLALQLPTALKIARRTRRLRLLAYVPMGFVRSFARAAGMCWGSLCFLMGRRPDSIPTQPAPMARERLP